ASSIAFCSGHRSRRRTRLPSWGGKSERPGLLKYRSQARLEQGSWPRSQLLVPKPRSLGTDRDGRMPYATKRLLRTSPVSQQILLRIVDEVITVIKGSIELWPTLVEICYFQKDRKGLPQTKVNNLPR